MPCGATMTRFLPRRKLQPFSTWCLLCNVPPKHEIRESSNRTRRARHEHSFPREEITAQAQKTMKTRTGFVFPALTKTPSRRRYVPRLHKLIRRESGEPRTTGKNSNIWLQFAIVEKPVSRRED